MNKLHKNKGNFGKNAPSYVDGRTLKLHYCIECDKKISYGAWRNGSKRCKSCSHKGKKFSKGHKKKLSLKTKERFKNPENHPQYKDGRSLKKCYCLDCDKKIHWRSKRCFLCASKFRKYPTKHCLDCGKLLGDRRAKHCKKCAAKHKENYKDRISMIDHFCPKCGKKLSHYSSKLCRGCADKEHSKKMTGKGNSRYGKVSHGNGSYYKKAWMRSNWELLFAKWLDKQGFKWSHEPQAFPIKYTYKKVKKEGTYRPDFYLPQLDLWVEIKGWWRGDAKVKFRAFKRLYPGIEIKVLGKEELKNDLLLQS